MEKTIDRTSYRRSARNDVANEKVQYQETTFKFANFIANEVIVSLLIIVIAHSVQQHLEKALYRQPLQIGQQII